MNVRTLAAGQVLVAVADGELDLPVALTHFDRLVRYWLTSGARDILLDCSRVTGELPPLERYEAGVRLAEAYAAVRGAGVAPPRIAVVAVPPLFDRGMFLQTVASNRGVMLRAFTTLEEAADWLGMESAALDGEPIQLPE